MKSMNRRTFIAGAAAAAALPSIAPFAPSLATPMPPASLNMAIGDTINISGRYLMIMAQAASDAAHRGRGVVSMSSDGVLTYVAPEAFNL